LELNEKKHALGAQGTTVRKKRLAKNLLQYEAAAFKPEGKPRGGGECIGLGGGDPHGAWATFKEKSWDKGEGDHLMFPRFETRWGRWIQNEKGRKYAGEGPGWARVKHWAWGRNCQKRGKQTPTHQRMKKCGTRTREPNRE